MPGEKTEEPTAKHLRDARLQGQVAKSQEVPATAVVMAVFGYVWLAFDHILTRLSGFIDEALSLIGRPFGEALSSGVASAFWLFVELAFPAVLLAAFFGAVGHVMQTGIVLAWKAATPSLDKLNPKQWFNKVFSVRNLVEFARSIIKIAIVALVFYLVFLDAVPLLMHLPGRGIPEVLAALGTIMRGTMVYALAAFSAVAALDWFYQRYQFLKEHRMSKEDIKNEYKEQEGDPTIKGQRRQLHQEMAMNDAAEGVKNASVLITNPTHLAIAVLYDEEKTPLPVIIAKGEGVLAQRMIKAAETYGVPVMRNVPLAHDLWEQGKEFEYIPSTLIKPVAEVLRWLKEMKETGGQA